MLVLTRKKGEAIMIGDDIELIVLGTEGDAVRLGIRAPKQIDIYRKEVWTSILQSNREASRNVVNPANLIHIVKKGDI
jgi:carbon storage regulator